MARFALDLPALFAYDPPRLLLRVRFPSWLPTADFIEIRPAHPARFAAQAATPATICYTTRSAVLGNAPGKTELHPNVI